MNNAKKVKVCQVTTADLSIRFLLMGQIAHLQRLGYEVHAAAAKGKWAGELQGRGIVFWDVPMTRRMWTLFSDLKALFQLIALFRREKYDVVHTHTPKASLLAHLAAFLVRVPVRIYTIHGLFFLETSSWCRKLLFSSVERVMAFLVHRALFVNKEDIDTVLRLHIYPAAKVAYVGGDIDTEHFNPARFSEADRERKRKELGIAPRRPVIGIVARLVWEKGYHDLFTAFLAVLQRHPNALLLVVGPEEPDKEDGFQPNDVFERYGFRRDSVLFVGERSDVVELYNLMDVFVLPSYREGLGLSLLEASAMQIPVVSTNIRGCRESVQDTVTGLLVPAHSSEFLARSILSVLENPSLARSFGIAGRKKVQKEFAKHIVCARIEKEYAQLIKEKHV